MSNPPAADAGQRETGSAAAELLAKWKEDIAERDRVLSQRRDDMFRGPIGLEEKLSIVGADLSMTIWYFNKLIAIVAEQEKRANPVT